MKERLVQEREDGLGKERKVQEREDGLVKRRWSRKEDDCRVGDHSQID